MNLKYLYLLILCFGVQGCLYTHKYQIIDPKPIKKHTISLNKNLKLKINSDLSYGLRNHVSVITKFKIFNQSDKDILFYPSVLYPKSNVFDFDYVAVSYKWYLVNNDTIRIPSKKMKKFTITTPADKFEGFENKLKEEELIFLNIFLEDTNGEFIGIEEIKLSPLIRDK